MLKTMGRNRLGDPLPAHHADRTFYSGVVPVYFPNKEEFTPLARVPHRYHRRFSDGYFHGRSLCSRLSGQVVGESVSPPFVPTIRVSPPRPFFRSPVASVEHAARCVLTTIVRGFYRTLCPSFLPLFHDFVSATNAPRGIGSGDGSLCPFFFNLSRARLLSCPPPCRASARSGPKQVTGPTWTFSRP